MNNRANKQLVPSGGILCVSANIDSRHSFGLTLDTFLLAENALACGSPFGGDETSFPSVTLPSMSFTTKMALLLKMFWGVARRKFLMYDKRFGITCLSHLQGVFTFTALGLGTYHPRIRGDYCI